MEVARDLALMFRFFLKGNLDHWAVFDQVRNFNPLCPLDAPDAGEIIATEEQIFGLRLGQAIQIQMQERPAQGLVALLQRVRGTGEGFPDAESACEPLQERRLAGTELPCEGDRQRRVVQRGCQGGPCLLRILSALCQYCAFVIH